MTLLEPKQGEFELIRSCRYTRPPVVAVCSKFRHSIRPSRPISDTKSIDIYTSEAPITTTDINIDRNINQLCLGDLAVNGVIDLYVVERSKGKLEKDAGKDAIFMSREAWVSCCPPILKHYELTVSATPRGPVGTWYGYDVVNFACIQQHYEC